MMRKILGSETWSLHQHEVLPQNYRNQEKSENYKKNYGKYGKVSEIVHFQ